jgi:PAS domain-containing protein
MSLKPSPVVPPVPQSADVGGEAVQERRDAPANGDSPEPIVRERRSSDRRYRSLFANMLDSLAHCRMIYQDGVPVDYEYIEVNPAFERVSGLTNVVGRRISEIIPDYACHNQAALETFARVARTGKPERWEHHLGAADKWFSLAIYSPAAGEFVLISEDVTKRKRAEEALRKLSLAVEQSPVSIVITDLEAASSMSIRRLLSPPDIPPRKRWARTRAYSSPAARSRKPTGKSGPRWSQEMSGTESSSTGARTARNIPRQPPYRHCARRMAG